MSRNQGAISARHVVSDSKKADTDGDGLSDANEARGVRGTGTHQPLPLWGANPRHKDLFIEADAEPSAQNAVVPFPTLTEAQAQGVQALMDLPDNDLLDLLLARSEPEGDLARPEVISVLRLMRPPQAA